MRQDEEGSSGICKSGEFIRLREEKAKGMSVLICIQFPLAPAPMSWHS